MAATDELALWQVCNRYSQAADRRDKDGWRAIMTDDCVIEGPGFRQVGIAACLDLIDQLESMFRTTRHCLSTFDASVSGDTAVSEAYCHAEHLLRSSNDVLVWAMRYKDSWRREGGQWKFARRELILDWQETRPVLIERADP